MAIRILVVDEAAFVRDSLKKALRSFLPDVDVFDAANGSRALPILRGNKIDLTLSDWDLPEMSGQELLQWTRDSEEYKKMPFIVVSGTGDRELVMKAIESGANDFMAKPFSPDELQKKVVKQLAKIGYRPKVKNNGASSSLEALQAGVRKPQMMKPRTIKSGAEALMTKKAAKPASSSADILTGGSRSKKGFNGSALLTIGQVRCKCAVHDISLTAAQLITERPPKLFQLFENGKIEIADDKTHIIATLNVYVHMMQASEPRPDASKMQLVVRYINNPPEAMEALSKHIAKNR
ncbi:Chemotaxis protein CheY [Thalassocella blandensis]|nr:Chemotaxis protein CheY [Thalassocella blandensis]